MEKHDIYLLRRLDVQPPITTQNDIFKNRYRSCLNGIDGFVISVKNAKKILSKIENFVVGEARWDDYFYNLVLDNFKTKVHDVTGYIFHPVHDIRWRNTVSNNILLFDKLGLSTSTCNARVKQTQPYDGDIIVSFFGNSETRIKTTTDFLYKLLGQNCNFHLIFVELQFSDTYFFEFLQDFFQKNSKQCTYIKINGNENNKYIFQKECLWNIATKYTKYNKLLFLDSDAYSLNPNWLKTCFDSIIENTITQGFNIVCDDKDENYTLHATSSIGLGVNSNTQYVSPGFCFGMYKSTFINNIEKFNENFIVGGGDSIFFNETTGNIKNIDNDKDNWFKNRDLKIKTKWINTSENIFHINHGMQTDGFFEKRFILLFEALNVSNLKLCEILKKDKNDIWAWTCENFIKFYIQNIKSIIKNGKPMDLIYSEYIKQKKSDFSQYNIFSNNYKLTKDYLTHSWCYNIKNSTKDGDSKIKFSTTVDGDDTIELECENKISTGKILLALSPVWDAMKLDIFINKRVQLVFKSINVGGSIDVYFYNGRTKIKSESKKIVIDEENIWKTIDIPIIEFNANDDYNFFAIDMNTEALVTLKSIIIK